MRYLFFDIECACVFKTIAKICAFGYVLTDETFSILERRDILLNPKGNFHLTDRKGEKGLVLPYAYGEFSQHVTFDRVYPDLKKLLEAEDTLVVGHSTMNDVKYLNLETKRFHLPSFRFSFADTQMLYMTRIGQYDHQFGLESITHDLGVAFTPHRAVDDAYATMRIAEALCKEENCDFASLLERLQIRLGRIENYKFQNTTSEQYINYQEEQKRQRTSRSKRRIEFFRFVNKRQNKRNKNQGGELAGKIFTFSHGIEEELELSKSFVEGIYAKGGEYTGKLSHCNAFVKYPGETGERCRRAEESDRITVMEISELEALL